MENVLVDSGVWYGLFTPKDQHRDQALEKAEYLDMLHVVMPWPILYETLNTKLARNPASLRLFETYLKKPHITYVDDKVYRDDALRLSIDMSLNRARPLSLVDCVVRLILDDANTKIDFLLTFNKGDFLDVCRRRGIELL